MATLSDINTKISNLLGVDTNTYTNANRLIDLNLWLQKITGMIFDAQDETDFDDLRYTDYPSVTFALVANQRDYAFTQFQTNTAGIVYGNLKIKEVSVTYDGVSWYRANPIDSAENDFGNPPGGASTANTTIDGYFSKAAPRYDFKYNALFLYPRASTSDVTGGAMAKVEFFRSPCEFTSAELTAGTVSPGIDPTFHMMLAYGAAYEFAQAQQMPQKNEIARELQNYEVMLRKQYSSKQLDRKYKLTPAYERYR